MKNNSTLDLAKCVAISLGLSITAFSPLAQAATGNWLNIGSDWNTNANWSGASYPGTAGGETATLPSAATAVNPNLDVSILINTLNIDNTQADYDITTATSSVFTIATSIVTTGGGTTNIAPQILFGSGARTINNGTTTLNLNGGISLIGQGPVVTLTNSTPIVVSSITTGNGPGADDVLSIQGTGSMTVTGSIAPGAGFNTISLAVPIAGYTGTLRLEGSNTFSTTTLWRGGTIEVANNGALGGQNITVGSSAVSTQASLLTTGAFSTPANITFSGANTSFTLGGSQTSGTSTYSGTVNLTALQAVNNGLNVTAATGGTVSFTNVISSLANSAHFITKIGNGVVKLSGVNTYGGGTLINAGTLEANTVVGGTNSSTGTGNVTVFIGGTLGGTGQIRPGVLGVNQQFVSVSNGGHLAPGVVAGTPGAGIGTLTLDSGGSTATNILSMASGSDFQFALGVAGTFAVDGTNDLLVISNSAASDVAFNGNAIDFLGTGAVGVYRLFDGLATSTEASDTWAGLTLGGVSTRQITSGLTVTNLAAGLTGTLFVGDGGSFGTQAGDIYLNVVAVPEPSTYAMIIGGFGILIGVQRARRRSL
ncbi:MAG: autotransporter-associated beta strand repeat-containing protein [Chthoniobacterales bacterium]